jgi:hypothetical protein
MKRFVNILKITQKAGKLFKINQKPSILIKCIDNPTQNQNP